MFLKIFRYRSQLFVVDLIQWYNDISFLSVNMWKLHIWFNLTIGVAFKLFKITPSMLKLIHWIQSHNDIWYLFLVSWFRPAKLPLTCLNCSTESKNWCLCLVSLSDLTTLLDWPWKTTPKWPQTLWNLLTGSEVMEISFSMSADVYSDLTFVLAMKVYPKMTPYML